MFMSHMSPVFNSVISQIESQIPNGDLNTVSCDDMQSITRLFMRAVSAESVNFLESMKNYLYIRR